MVTGAPVRGVIEVLLTSKYQKVSWDAPSPLLNIESPAFDPTPHLADHSNLATGWSTSPIEPASLSETVLPRPADPDLQPSPRTHPHEIDPLYLFACHLAWEQREEPSAAWDLLAAARSSNGDTRAHARALLASSRHFAATGQGAASCRATKRKRSLAMETDMNSPYGLDIIDNCSECTLTTPGFFCGFSPATLQSLTEVSHKSILPAGAILFVEGQAPRGMFILCSGKVNLSTTSREGKILILKTAEAGEALGLSAAISGTGYESTAETDTPCHLNFVDRKHLLELMESHSEVGMHTAQCLSRDFQTAYRDIHDLVLTRSSAGKLARLLLSHDAWRGSRRDSHPFRHDARRNGTTHWRVARNRNPASG